MTRDRIERATALLAGLAVAVLATTATAAPSRTVNELGPLTVGKPCPSFAGFTLNNETLSLTRLLNPPKDAPASALVISFFATWCKPCKDQLPIIDRVVASLAGKGVRGVLIDFGEDAETVAPFVEQQKLHLPVIPDRFTKIAGRLGIDKTLPRTLVVGRDGTVRAIFEHEGDDFEKALRAAVEAAMR